jgi:predicted transcriptional regulator
MELNKHDKALIESLSKIGINKKEAETLIYIKSRGPCRASDIECNMRLRQPEVSVAVNRLIERKWVKKELEKKEGKGRPVHIYKMKKDFRTVIDEVISLKEEEIDKLKETIDFTKRLAS